MTDKATHMDARLMGLSKVRRKDGDWFEMRIQVHPEDMPSEMYGVPLGTRIGVALVQIADDETEKPAEKTKTPFKDLPPSQQAGMLAKDPTFQNWCNNRAQCDGLVVWTSGMADADHAATYIRNYCQVSSRSDLGKDSDAQSMWGVLLEAFETDTGRRAEVMR